MAVIQWKDNQGRAWSCRLTIGDAKRLKAAGYDIGDPKNFEKLFANPLTLIELLAEAMRPQWVKELQGETDEAKYIEFANILTEDEGRLLEVQRCFVAGLTDFFRRLGDLPMAAVVEKAQAAVEKTREAMLARANSPAIDRLVDKAIVKQEMDFAAALAAEERKLEATSFGSTSTNVPASSESPPMVGPIES